MRRQVQRHVGQQGGLDSRRVKPTRPIEHVRIGTGPDFNLHSAEDLDLFAIKRGVGLRCQVVSLSWQHFVVQLVAIV